MKFLQQHFPFVQTIIFHILSLIGLYYYWDPIWFLLTFIGYFFFVLIGFDIGLHRYFSHRSFTCKPITEFFLAVMSIYSCGGNPIQFTLHHRMHHQLPDTDSDPHIAGTTVWHIWFQYLNKNRPTKIDLNLAKDIKDNLFYQFIEKWGTLIYLLTVGIASLISIKFTLYLFIVTGALSIHYYGSINYLGHRWGYRNHNTNDLSTNNPWGVYMFGGQWHNNHHRWPYRYSFKDKPWEWDLLGWLIEHVFAIKVKK